MLQLDPSKRLTAAEVMGHPWMEGFEQVFEEPQIQRSRGHAMLEVGIGSFSGPSSVRSRDYSFDYEPPHSADENAPEQTPTFSCRTSFSAYLIEDENSMPSSAFSGFSFSHESSVEFSSPIPSMQSFTFSSPDSNIEESGGTRRFNEMEFHFGTDKKGSRLEKLFDLADSSSFVKQETDQLQRTQSQRGSISKTRIMKIHSRRNRTIGFGENDQISLEVAESVIWWATAPPLRLSLVC